jgi:signal transduction histidine kinase/HAMP domain-containing protein/ActR/RegA family two-component response regulator
MSTSAETSGPAPPTSASSPEPNRSTAWDGDAAGDRGEFLRSLRDALRALRQGDSAVRLPAGIQPGGILGELSLAFNDVAQQHAALVQELDRVARTAGLGGELGVRASLGPAQGSWASAVASVNVLLDATAYTTTEATRTLALVAEGDLSRDMPLHADGRPLRGDLLGFAHGVNEVMRRLRVVTAGVSRVAREIGTEGKLGAQAELDGLSGTWKDLVHGVNLLASNLTAQVRNIVLVATAIANGDLSQKITVETRGDLLELKNAINATVDQLRAFAAEIIRVANEVGTEGKLGAQAEVRDVSGVWQELTNGVNDLAANLTAQVRNIAVVSTAIARGDLSQKISVEAKGEILELKDTINSMVEQLRTFASEVTRVAREVGTEGRLGAQADVRGVSGTWKDLTDSVNMLAGNLTDQVRNITMVTTAVAHGDLSKKITVDARGELLELKNTVNALVDRLQTFAAEVTRVAREVGTEGKLGGQADVQGVSGTWKDLTDNVNVMASNLTGQVRGIAKVVTAVARGDLSQKFVVEAKGEIAALADTINSMTDSLRTFAAQVTTVAREVGIDGKLGGQAMVPALAGTWRELTDTVNMLAGNLTDQVRNIALVTTAVAHGDLSQKITVEAKGEVLELKNTVNAMVDQLRTFAREVTRVAREVGTEGKLAGQARVPGVGGTWQELTESVNVMASNLTSQVRGIAKVVTAVANGDLTQRLVLEAQGEIAALADTINSMTDTLRTFADQVTTVAREVGNEGKLGGQARVPGAAGTWKGLTESVNMFAGNLTAQVRNIALVTTAVANGDLSKKIKVEAKGEVLELKDTINDMVEQLRTFAAEVTRVAREVGTEGQLGGQALVPGVSGTWKDLTDNVNVMASNLTDQVRGISKVVTSVARGDLGKKLGLVAKGEIAAVAETINDMTDTLRTFADQVSTVAREVGIEGKLGGQAKVPSATGTWRDVTDNVNQLAANLTNQVRAIFEVARAVIQGDLTRSITVAAQGEVFGLKDTINQMIANLRDTTQKNKEQDWLKTNLARFFGVMQGQRSLQSLSDQTLSELGPAMSVQHGAFYLAEQDGETMSLRLTSSYAYTKRKRLASRFALGEGLVGQCALEKKPIVVTELPEEYVAIASGLGESPPRNLAVFPVLFEGRVQGVIELGTFHEFTSIQLNFLEQLMLSLGLAVNLIGSSMRTEQLLRQLKGSNAELENRRKELEEKAQLLEVRNREIAQASASLEGKAQELGRVSEYKSRFLTNMSHEIRTPLNSVMILAQMLAANEEKTLSDKQRDWAETIHSSGRDLLDLINEILDLSKVEAGRIDVSLQPSAVHDVHDFVERTFRAVALQRGLEFDIEIAPRVPASLTTDRRLLEQVLKNLLSNAFKFTERGRVSLRVDRAPEGAALRSERLRQAPSVVAFAVSDTGIGVSKDQESRIFEAFQQGDTTVTRKYGGTGLGLTISREYARLLGGEIALESTPGKGSTFTLYLPAEAEGAAPALPAQETTRDEGAPAAQRAPAAQPAPAAGEGRQAPAVSEGRQGPAVTEGPQAPARDGRQPLAGRRILVVEDDARNLYATTALLEGRGATVVPASNAREALSALRQHPDADIVLMDIMMPEMDGYEATRQIRSIGEFTELPIIALTAKASASDREQSRAAGCNDYIVKPADADTLVSVIVHNLREAA